jgi:hypothetical protein
MSVSSHQRPEDVSILPVTSVRLRRQPLRFRAPAPMKRSLSLTTHKTSARTAIRESNEEPHEGNGAF